MVEERGGVVLDNTSAVDSDHGIRLVVEEVSIDFLVQAVGEDRVAPQ